MPERDELPFSKQALKGWRTRFPGQSRAGIDLALWDLVALDCCHRRHYMAAAAILVQGDTYLRPSELLGLKPQHVIRPTAARRAGIWGLIVGPFEDGKPTKAKAYDDCVLLDTGSRFEVNSVMAALFQFSKTSEFLFQNLDPRNYGLQISKSAKATGLEALHLTLGGES